MYAMGITSSDGRCELALNQWLPRWQLPLVLVCAGVCVCVCVSACVCFIFVDLFLCGMSPLNMCGSLCLCVFMSFVASFSLFIISLFVVVSEALDVGLGHCLVCCVRVCFACCSGE